MKFKLLALIATLFTGGYASAQPVWTFEQVLQSALDSHPAIMGKRAAQGAAQADQKGAEWLRYPTPSIETGTQSNGQNSSLVRIEQPLWTGGRITAAIDAAGRRLDAADAALRETELDTTLKVIAAHIEALRQKARKKSAREGVEAHEKLLGMIRRRVGQDVSSLTDQRLAEARLYQAINDQSQVSQALNNALAQLAQLSGKPVADVSEQGVGMLGAPVSMEAAQTLALDYSPTLRRLVYEEEAANADIDAKRSTYMPQLSLRLQKSMGPGQLSVNSAMVVLQAQPGAGLSAGSGVDAAIARRDAAQMARATAERSTIERIALDWNELIDARVRLENAVRSCAISTEVFESYTRQYVIGRKSWLDVLNAVREATQSQFALEDTRAQVIAAGLRLRAQAGTLATPIGAEQIPQVQVDKQAAMTPSEKTELPSPLPAETVPVPAEPVIQARLEEKTQLKTETRMTQPKSRAEVRAEAARSKAGKKEARAAKLAARKSAEAVGIKAEQQAPSVTQTSPGAMQPPETEKNRTEAPATVPTELPAQADTEEKARLKAETRAEAARIKAEIEAEIEAETKAEKKANADAQAAVKADTAKPKVRQPAEAAHIKAEQQAPSVTQTTVGAIQASEKNKPVQNAPATVAAKTTQAVQAEAEENARLKAEARAEAARIKAEIEAEIEAETKAEKKANADAQAAVKPVDTEENTRLKAEARAEAARIKAEIEAEIEAETQAEKKAKAAAQTEPARETGVKP